MADYVHKADLGTYLQQGSTTTWGTKNNVVLQDLMDNSFNLNGGSTQTVTANVTFSGSVVATSGYTGTGLTNTGSLTLTATNSSCNIVTGTGGGDNFTINSTGLVYEGDTGYVGIKTSTPASMLEINSVALDAISGLGAAANYALLINQNLTNDAGAGIAFGNVSNIGSAIVSIDKGSNSPSDLAFYTKVSIGLGDAPVERLRITKDGNVGIGVTAFGTSATNVLGITADGTIPSTSPAGMIQIYSDDSSLGATNATLAIRTEQGVDTDAWTRSHALRVWINGIEYRIGLDAV